MKLDNIVWIVFPLIAGIANAGVTNILQIYGSGFTPIESSFWFATIVTAVTGLIVAGLPIQIFDTEIYVFSFPLLGLLMFATQMFMGLACRYEKRASVLSPILSTNIVFIYIIEIIIGKEIKTLECIGAIIVLTAVSLLSVAKD